MAKTRIDYDDDKAIEQLLLGRKIVAVDERNETLTLDNGVVVEVQPNDGGCSCGAGDYQLTSLATVDNIITAVRVADEDLVPEGEDSHSYRIYVVADAVEINVLQVDGDDGNGYYGTGFALIVSGAGRV